MSNKFESVSYRETQQSAQRIVSIRAAVRCKASLLAHVMLLKHDLIDYVIQGSTIIKHSDTILNTKLSVVPLWTTSLLTTDYASVCVDPIGQAWLCALA